MEKKKYYFFDRGMGRMGMTAYTEEELGEETRRSQERLMNPPAPPIPKREEWEKACSDPQEQAAMKCLCKLIS